MNYSRTKAAFALLALGAAAIALWLKAPYLVVVLVGAIAAGLGRLAGLP